MESDPNIDNDVLLEYASAVPRDGVYRLWLAVFISSFSILKNGKEGAGPARSFLFGESPFFDLVADGLGYEPDALRERVAKALKTKSNPQYFIDIAHIEG